MRPITSLILLVLIIPSLGSECERKRLTELNECLLELSDGTLLYPSSSPFDVIFREDLQNLSAALDGLAEVNKAFGTWSVFNPIVSTDQWNNIELLPLIERVQLVIVSEGFAGAPTWDGAELLSDPGGMSILYWQDDHRIVSAEITLSPDYTYDPEWVRKGMIHELGHVLALAHDPRSIDLGSCMTSPPYDNCTLILADVDCVEEGIEHAKTMEVGKE